MKILSKSIITVLGCILSFFLQAQNVSDNLYTYESTESFFKNSEEINKENIDWGYLTVPENWEKPEKKIKLAIAQLKSFKQTKKTVVFISGGPGGWSIGPIRRWLHHPIREEANLVLIDLRGTGFSEPSLCPDLGEGLLEIFAENHSVNEDIKAMVDLSKECKKDLIERNIDIKSYNSRYIANDLHALKEVLKIDEWFVYGVSYGTYISQVYLQKYPDEIKGLILDSPIANASEYYNFNTSNYIQSLKTLFLESKTKYNNLEERYYAVIDKLEKNPVTVSMNENDVSSRKFTYNADDFKIVIHQSLYRKNLIEIIPLIIIAFDEEDDFVLANLAQAFSGGFKKDFGTYYSMLSNDISPRNSTDEFQKDASKYTKNNGGLLFYFSELNICKTWNENDSLSVHNSDSLALSEWDKPALIFSGKYDPITPLSNGKKTADKFTNSYLYEIPYGHGNSFSSFAKNVVQDFINSVDEVDDKMNLPEINFADNITKNRGVISIAKNIQRPNIIFLSPFIIAILILCISFLGYSILLLKKFNKIKEKWLKTLLVVNSLLALVIISILAKALTETSANNFYVLLFGLPNKYDFLYTLVYVFIGLVIVTFLYFMWNFNKISKKEIYSSIIFSFFLILTYFFYWGFI